MAALRAAKCRARRSPKHELRTPGERKLGKVWFGPGRAADFQILPALSHGRKVHWTPSTKRCSLAAARLQWSPDHVAAGASKELAAEAAQGWDLGSSSAGRAGLGQSALPTVGCCHEHTRAQAQANPSLSIALCKAALWMPSSYLPPRPQHKPI